MLNDDVAALFKPFSSGGFTIRNRVVMAPMSRYFAVDGVPVEETVDYYARRAEGGVGLIITEGASPDHPAAAARAGVPHFHGAALGVWKRVAAKAQSHGARIFVQLWHTGIEANDPSGASPVAPSRLSPPWPARHVPMSTFDVNAVITSYAEAARSAYELGFDGVNLHGAHGYLIDQFLWQETNHRDDEYGGSIDRRSRFAAELVAAVREHTSPRFVIMFRFSQWKIRDYGAEIAVTPAALETVLRPLVDAGVDLFDASTRRFWEPAFASDPKNLAGWTHALTTVPTMTVGSISLASARRPAPGEPEITPGMAAHNIRELARRLGADEFQLAAVGRALIANPDWANIVQQGDFETLRPYEPGMLATLV
jgi:2,4-dienoyl-CoA reductase-like NADH-dependent reductase (Old Yellow Enzyme family)